MKWEDTVLDDNTLYKIFEYERDGGEYTVSELRLLARCLKLSAVQQAEQSFKAGIKEVVNYFFYEAGLVGLMGCSEMRTAKRNLRNWETKLKEWGVNED